MLQTPSQAAALSAGRPALLFTGTALAGLGTPPLEACLRALWPNLVAPVDVSEDGQISRLSIVFEGDPYANDTLELVPEIREELSAGLGTGL